MTAKKSPPPPRAGAPPRAAGRCRSGSSRVPLAGERRRDPRERRGAPLEVRAPLLRADLAGRLARADLRRHHLEGGEVSLVVGGVRAGHQLAEPDALGVVLGEVRVEDTGEAPVDPLERDLLRHDLRDVVRRPALGRRGPGDLVPVVLRQLRAPRDARAPAGAAASRAGDLPGPEPRREAGEPILEPLQPPDEPLRRGEIAEELPHRLLPPPGEVGEGLGERLELGVEPRHLRDGLAEPGLGGGERVGRGGRPRARWRAPARSIIGVRRRRSCPGGPGPGRRPPRRRARPPCTARR